MRERQGYTFSGIAAEGLPPPLLNFSLSKNFILVGKFISENTQFWD